MQCRVCKSDDLGRVPRKGWRRAASIFGLYPWECLDCAVVRLYRARRTRHGHSRTIYASVSPGS